MPLTLKEKTLKGEDTLSDKSYLKDELHRLLVETIDKESYYQSMVGGITFENDGGLESSHIRCGFKRHQSKMGKVDKTPSLRINLEDGAYCFGCGTKATDIVWFHSQWTGVDLHAAKKDLYESYIKKLVPESYVVNSHKNLLAQIKGRSKLGKRGIGLEAIKRFKLGWDIDQDRVVIPIQGHYTGFTDCRMVTLKKKGWYEARNLKMYKNLPYDHLEIRDASEQGSPLPKDGLNRCSIGRNIYPMYTRVVDSKGGIIEEPILNQNELVLVEGEFDAIVLNTMGFNAITLGSVTGWHRSDIQDYLYPKFKGKKIIICFDDDPAGRKAAEKLQTALKNIADKVIITYVPRGKDISEYFSKHKGTKDEFRQLLDSELGDVEVVFETETPIAEAGVNELDNVSDINNPANYNKRVTVRTMVVGEREDAYSLPKNVSVLCDRDAGENICGVCPNNTRRGETNITFSDYDADILKFINSTDFNIQEYFKSYVGIPKMCNKFNVHKSKSITAQWLVLSPPLSGELDTTQETDLIALNIGPKIDLNKYCLLTGYIHHMPKTQRLVFVIVKHETLQNDYESYKVPSKGRIEDLKKKFGPENMSSKSIIEKLEEIAELVSRNYTHIYHRPELHLAELIRLHSAYEKDFEGQTENAYIESIIIGDTKQAKSRVVKMIQKLYQMGVFVDSGGTSRAGTVGGQLPDGSFKWGAFVQCHRRAYAVDESKDFGEVLETMKVVREGVATYQKVIGSRQTKCQVRFCCLANDPKGLLRRRAFGCTSLLDLIKDSADISRFTFFVIVRAGDIPSVNKRKPAAVKTKITELDFREVLMSAWSRESKDIEISSSAIDACYEYADEMAKKYSASLHIVQETTQAKKILDVAISIAQITHNVSEDGTKLIVSKVHVKAARWFFKMIYTSNASSYLQYSERERRRNTLKNKKELFKRVFQKEKDRAGNLEHCIEYLMDSTTITNDNIQDAFIHCNDAMDARNIVKELVVSRALTKGPRGYEYTDAFVHYINELKDKYL